MTVGCAHEREIASALARAELRKGGEEFAIQRVSAGR